ncbi:MAG: phosphomannomutase [Limisphaerales bacterium]
MTEPDTASPSLRSRLNYEPVPLKFGTSGRRGPVAHLTQLEVYLNVLAELGYLQSLSAAEGGIVPGEEFYFACDLRPSSSRFVAREQGRGELAQAVAAAIEDAGMRPVFLGQVPTPALAAFAWEHRRGGIMVTGSHIPFDRNGYKTNTACGELLKKDEAPIQHRVEELRRRLYAQRFSASPFDERGLFKSGHRELPAEYPAARQAYLRRYTDFFAGRGLDGKRLLVYQHSAVGRDLLVELLDRLGAEVIPAGRSETFVPIDTENINDAVLGRIQALATEAWRTNGPIDAVVSTDGDSDRPLILGVEPDGGPAACRVRFFGGDLLGMVVAEFLGADAVIVPINCNDAVDVGALKDVLQPKTRIGSPYVIAGMESALGAGCKAVCGWEANGGFLTGSDIRRGGRILKALPTRDAFLPILGALLGAAARAVPLSQLFARLPARFSRSALIPNFPRPASLRLMGQFSPQDPGVRQVLFEAGQIALQDQDGRPMASTPAEMCRLGAIRDELARFFTPDLGFGNIRRINYTDGVRVYFANGDIAHFRPSGNADELRIYAVAGTPERAEVIAKLSVAEPEGILRRLEKAAECVS